MQKTGVLRAAALIAFTAASIVVLVTFKPEPAKRPLAKPEAMLVEVQALQPQRYQLELESQGLVESRHRVSLSSQVSGLISMQSDTFFKGGTFKKGDILVQVNDADYQTALLSAIAEEQKAQLDLAKAKATSAIALQEWGSLEKQGERSNFAARRMEVTAAEAAVAAAQAHITKAQRDLERTIVRAPFDGYVISDVLTTGNLVSPGTVFGTIIATNLLQVSLPASTRWRAWFNDTEVPVEIWLSNMESAKWQGTIVGRVAKINGQSRQMELIANIAAASGNAPDVHLFPGDFVQAKIHGVYLHDVYVLPRQALLDTSFIWVVRNNRLHKTPVSVRWLDTRTVLIDSKALPAGTLVATNGIRSAVSGTEVRVKVTQDQLEQQVSAL